MSLEEALFVVGLTVLYLTIGLWACVVGVDAYRPRVLRSIPAQILIWWLWPLLAVVLPFAKRDEDESWQ